MTKNIEREAFEALPLAKLALDQDWVMYHKESNTYYPNEDFCPDSAPETMNFAWEAWQAAKAHEAEKLKGCVVVPVEPTDAMIDAVRSEHEGEPYLPYSLYKSFLKAANVEAARGGNE